MKNTVGEALNKSGYNLVYFKKNNSTLKEDFFHKNCRRIDSS